MAAAGQHPSIRQKGASNPKELQHQMTLINTNFMTNWPYVKSRGRENRKKETDKTSPPPNISPLTLTMALNLVREDKEGPTKSLLADKSADSKNGSKVQDYEQIQNHKKKVSIV